MQFDQFTWYFNIFDRSRLVRPRRRRPIPQRLTALERYNEPALNCEATFDARADNLLQFLDRVAKDIGSASAVIKDRSEGYNSGWFDTRADDIFMNPRASSMPITAS